MPNLDRFANMTFFNVIADETQKVSIGHIAHFGCADSHSLMCHSDAPILQLQGRMLFPFINVGLFGCLVLALLVRSQSSRHILCAVHLESW
jgi:hypothetical protein